MTLDNFLKKIRTNPVSVEFTETMAIIDSLYEFTPTSFTNGTFINEAGQNSGSCKLFAFAKLQQLSKEETLACFGTYYYNDVLKNKEGTDHQNIRNFMKTGWEGISFEKEPLREK